MRTRLLDLLAKCRFHILNNIGLMANTRHVQLKSLWTSLRPLSMLVYLLIVYSSLFNHTTSITAWDTAFCAQGGRSPNPGRPVICAFTTFAVGEENVTCLSWSQYFRITLEALAISSVALGPHLSLTSVEIAEATSSKRFVQIHLCSSVSESPHLLERVCLATLYEMALDTHGAYKVSVQTILRFLGDHTSDANIWRSVTYATSFAIVETAKEVNKRLYNCFIATWILQQIYYRAKRTMIRITTSSIAKSPPNGKKEHFIPWTCTIHSLAYLLV